MSHTTYAIRAYRRKDGSFHAYVETNKRSEWKTLKTAVAHAKDFTQRFPEFITEVECDNGKRHTVITGVSHSPKAGLHLYTATGCLQVSTTSSRAILEALGQAPNSHSQFLGESIVNIAAIVAKIEAP